MSSFRRACTLCGFDSFPQCKHCFECLKNESPIVGTISAIEVSGEKRLCCSNKCCTRYHPLAEVSAREPAPFQQQQPQQNMPQQQQQTQHNAPQSHQQEPFVQQQTQRSQRPQYMPQALSQQQQGQLKQQTQQHNQQAQYAPGQNQHATSAAAHQSMQNASTLVSAASTQGNWESWCPADAPKLKEVAKDVPPLISASAKVANKVPCFKFHTQTGPRQVKRVEAINVDQVTPKRVKTSADVPQSAMKQSGKKRYGVIQEANKPQPEANVQPPVGNVKEEQETLEQVKQPEANVQPPVGNVKEEQETLEQVKQEPEVDEWFKPEDAQGSMSQTGWTQGQSQTGWTQTSMRTITPPREVFPAAGLEVQGGLPQGAQVNVRQKFTQRSLKLSKQCPKFFQTAMHYF